MRHAVIIGGGIIGLLAAYELRQRGLDVTVLDRDEPGAACSSGNTGWIVPSMSGPLPAPGVRRSALRQMLQRDSPLYIRPRAIPRLAPWLKSFWLHSNHRAYHDGMLATAELSRQTMALYDRMISVGLNFEMHRDGILFVSRNRADLDHILHDIGPLRDYGYAPRLLEHGELRDIEPNLRRDIAAAGALIERERHVRPEQLVRALLQWLTGHGVTVHSGVDVRGPVNQDGREVVGVLTSKGTMIGDLFLIAAGVWSGQVGSAFGLRLPLHAGKGYSITLPVRDGTLRQPLYLIDAKVACSPFNGSLRIAGTMELSGINATIDQRRITAMERAMDRYVVGWRDDYQNATPWMGLRPLTPDGLPIIGQSPAHDNLFVATGHGMLGVTLGPATAEVITDLMIDGSSRSRLEAFSPARF